jgi:prepilin-type N-terminal cleavage/methylation domain-containing protein
MIRRASRTHSLKGFTIVELLIVVVVIAILAAITIVSYNGIQNRAIESSVRADFSNFAKRMELYKTDSAVNQYPTTSGEFTSSLGIKFSKANYHSGGSNNVLYCRGPNGASWALVAVDRSSRGWRMTSQGAMESYSGAGVNSNGLSSQVDVCPAAITGGQTTANAWAYTGSSWQAWAN